MYTYSTCTYEIWQMINNNDDVGQYRYVYATVHGMANTLTNNGIGKSAYSNDTRSHTRARARISLTVESAVVVDMTWLFIMT